MCKYRMLNLVMFQVQTILECLYCGSDEGWLK